MGRLLLIIRMKMIVQEKPPKEITISRMNNGSVIKMFDEYYLVGTAKDLHNRHVTCLDTGFVSTVHMDTKVEGVEGKFIIE